MLMNVVPSLGRGNSKVYPKATKSHWFSIRDRDGQRLGFPGKPGVEPGLTSYQHRNPKSAPDAGGPPSAPLALYPVGRRRYREGMDDPWLANMGVQHDSVDVR